MSARRERTLFFLRERGAGDVPHARSDLLSHLKGTEAIVRGWGEPETVQLAALGHALYGTAGFDLALATLDERALVADLLGREVEAEVYRYACCDRSSVYPLLGDLEVAFRDRFDGRVHPVAATELRTFAAVTMANECDLARRGLFSDAERVEVAALFAGFQPCAPDLVRRAMVLLVP